MKKIYFHIGFPKTATTTFQKSIFPQLNNNNTKYIGKFEDGRGYIDNHINMEKILDGKLNKTIEDFNIIDKDIIIISDEFILFHFFYLIIENKTGLIDSFFINLRNFLTVKDYDIEILYLHRETGGLMSSYYAESYYLFQQYDYLNTYEKFKKESSNSLFQLYFNDELFFSLLNKSFTKQEITRFSFSELQKNNKEFYKILIKHLNFPISEVNLSNISVENKRLNNGIKTISSISLFEYINIYLFRWFNVRIKINQDRKIIRFLLKYIKIDYYKNSTDVEL